MKKFFKKNQNTSWEKSSAWYNKLVGDQGHYYHEHVIIPSVLRLLNLKPGASVLDVGCGQGILGKKLSKGAAYQGIDASMSLIKAARAQDKSRTTFEKVVRDKVPQHEYLCADAAKPLPITKKDFTNATIILALQNMEFPDAVLKNIAAHMRVGGRLVIVLNHPAFRIPRQSGWDVNSKSNLQYRWVNRYLTPMKIPIQMHPGRGQSELTWSFHEPISVYAGHLKNAGLVIENIEEWSSDKTSTSREKKREDRARAEIPLFMAIVAKKLS